MSLNITVCIHTYTHQEEKNEIPVERYVSLKGKTIPQTEKWI